MKKSHLSARLAAVTGGCIVAAGAFGAHALKEVLMEADMTDVWKTASMYGLVHAALALLWLLEGERKSWPGVCWLAGVWLFSGSLYGLSLGGPGVLGPITPLGGLLFIVGWLGAAVTSFKNPSGNHE